MWNSIGEHSLPPAKPVWKETFLAKVKILILSGKCIFGLRGRYEIVWVTRDKPSGIQLQFHQACHAGESSGLKGPDEPRCERPCLLSRDGVWVFFSRRKQSLSSKDAAYSGFWGAGDTQLLWAKKHIQNCNMYQHVCFDYLCDMIWYDMIFIIWFDMIHASWYFVGGNHCFLAQSFVKNPTYVVPKHGAAQRQFHCDTARSSWWGLPASRGRGIAEQWPRAPGYLPYRKDYTNYQSIPKYFLGILRSHYKNLYVTNSVKWWNGNKVGTLLKTGNR